MLLSIIPAKLGTKERFPILVQLWLKAVKKGYLPNKKQFS